MKQLFFRQDSSPADPSTSTDAPGLGTFGGVYTPSILTILGVIMYLRFGWVVGHVGLVGALVIVTLSTAITLLTALSICAIATDRVVRAGGAYYMISRSLGLETGGSVGIPLYLAQALSVALYTIGFAESVVQTFGLFDQVQVALVTTLLVGILALTSAEAAIRAQYVIMAVIVLSLVSLALGRPLTPELEIPLWITSEQSFWQVFAVFFPAVTGIMAGVNMSGDLKDPTRAIPLGTLAAVGTGYGIYMVLPVVLSMRATPEQLVENPLIMMQMSFWGPAILFGIWGATLSSAIGSILGAPRVLQALARDGVLPGWLRWLGRGHGVMDEPRVGTIVTLIVATLTVMIGELNLIAPVLTMFFLTTYLVLNASAGIEGFLQSPSYRPAFRVHWLLSLSGAVGCLLVMFLINAAATVAAAGFVLVLYVWLQRRSLEAAWGDVRSGLWMAVLRAGVFQVHHTDDPRNWRPHVMVLSRDPTQRWSLIELADALTHSRGLVTVSSVVLNGAGEPPERLGFEDKIREYLNQRRVQALVRVFPAQQDPFEGAGQLIEAYGLGPLVPNTILLGDCQNPERLEAYCGLIRRIHKAQRNVVILRENEGLGFGRRRRIDVWWGGLQANGGLMLLLAYLLRMDIDWRNAQIRLKLVAPNEMTARMARGQLETLLKQLRLGFEAQVIVAEGRMFDEILHESSRSADLVFLGLGTPGAEFTEYYRKLHQRTEDLPTTIFVLAAPNYDFSEVLLDTDTTPAGDRTVSPESRSWTATSLLPSGL